MQLSLVGGVLTATDVLKATTDEEIFIVDDDPAVRDAWSALFADAGYRVTCFPEAAPFILAARQKTPAGIILDVYLPGMSGLDILKEIDALYYAAPIFVVSARSDIATAVESIKRGAFDFHEKGRAPETLVARMREAIKLYADGYRQGGRVDDGAKSFPGRELLTPREHAVLALVTLGASSQAAADSLLVSRRTVEIHRAHILRKLNARNTADLLRIVLNHGRGYS